MVYGEQVKRVPYICAGSDIGLHNFVTAYWMCASQNIQLVSIHSFTASNSVQLNNLYNWMRYCIIIVVFVRMPRTCFHFTHSRPVSHNTIVYTLSCAAADIRAHIFQIYMVWIGFYDPDCVQATHFLINNLFFAWFSFSQSFFEDLFPYMNCMCFEHPVPATTLVMM